MEIQSNHQIEPNLHLQNSSHGSNLANLAEMQPSKSERIHQLPSDVVDQIAAGEVVERPSHMVKELVENAIDAGADSIEVEYDLGGRRVRVTDNGYGIAADDLGLALARHATSKINAANDLWSLNSFGFRGEALASIAAVSRLTLQSRQRDSAQASRIIANYGSLTPVEPSAGNVGTTLVIENLFENIPARLKFLKSDSAEHGQIKATLKALALANENIEFRLRTKGRLEQVWPKASSFIERAKQVLEGIKLYENNYVLQSSSMNGYRAHIVFASPHDVTGNSRSIHLFVQGRWVQDRSLQAAVTEAFRGLLMHGEFPVAVVRLEVPCDEIDVNIHPTKSQVKFRDSQQAFRAINRCLREAIEKAPWLTSDTQGRIENQPENHLGNQLGNQVQSQGHIKPQSSAQFSLSDFVRPYESSIDSSAASMSSDPLESPSVSESLASSPLNSVGRFEAPEFNRVTFQQKNDFWQTNELPKVSFQPNQPNQNDSNQDKSSNSTHLAYWSQLQVLGQANLTYILTQAGNRLVIVDQHAAHERVAYEKLMRAWMSGESEVQQLLIPITIDLEPEGAEALVSISSDLERLGVQIDQVGPQSIAIRALPIAIKDGALTKVLAELAHEMLELGGSFALERKISDLCASMACHSVVRAGQALSMEQMKSLLLQMDEFPLSSFCPHGRPVSVDYPFAKLERDFGRLV
jgi:DNA mismatch repair protein MutL